MKMLRTALALVFVFALGRPAAFAVVAGEGEPIFISATRIPTPLGKLPTNTSIVTEEEIARWGAKTLDEALIRVPSIQFQKSGTLGGFSTLRVRGVTSSAHVQVLVDDLPIGGIATQFTDLSQIPTENIERIEIVRGASAMLYGASSMGGVINVITKKHDKPEPQSFVGWEMRSFQTSIYKAGIGLGNGTFDGFVTGSRYFTDGYQENSRADNTNVSGNGGVALPGGGRLSLSASRTTHEVGDSQGTTVPFHQWDRKRERAAADKTSLVKKGESRGQVRLQNPLGALGDADVMVYGSDLIYENFATPGGALTANFRNQIFGADAHVALQQGGLVGFSYEQDRKRNYLADAFPQITNWGAYLQQSINAGGLSLIPAVRMDVHSAFGHQYSPRLTVVYNANEALKFSANAARSHRSPDLSDLYVDFPTFNFFANPNLRPESLVSYDAGLAVGKPEAQVIVTGFYSRIKDRITINATFDSTVNAPRAEISGYEAEIKSRSGKLSNSINYTYTRAIGNSLSSTKNVQLRLTPRHAGNLVSALQINPSLSLSNGLRYVSKSYSQDNQKGFVLPPFFVWDVSLQKRILAADFTLAVNNVANRRYAETASFFGLIPQPSRTFWGGVTVRFTN